MKYLIVFNAVSILWCICSSTAANQTLRIAYIDAAPYSYQDTNNLPKGMLVDKFRELAVALGTDYEFIYLPHKRQIDFIKQGKVDVWAGQQNSRISDEYAVQSQLPLFVMTMQVHWKKGTTPIASIGELLGKNLILISSYSYGGNYANLSKASPMLIQSISHEDGFDRLFSGTNHYLLGYERISKQVIEKFDIKGFQSASLDSYKLYLKLAKSYPNAEQIMSAMNGILEKHNASAFHTNNNSVEN